MLDGFDSYSFAWEMQQNTGIPNSRAYGFSYMNDNALTTSLPSTADFSIAIAKNGVIVPFPNAAMGAMTNNQGYQISLETELDLVTGDYVEVFIKRNNAIVSSVVISDMQFRIRD